MARQASGETVRRTEGRLVVDALRRTWATYATTGVMVALMAGTGWRIAMLVSLLSAAALGPMLVLGRAAIPREIHYLPIATRRIWRAAWCLWTFGAVIWLAVVKLGVFAVWSLRPGPVGDGRLGAIALSSVYDLAYAGAIFSVPLVMQGLPRVLKLRRPTSPGTSDIIGTVVAGASWLALGGALLAVPFVAANVLPTRWVDIDGSAAIAILIGLALMVAGYFDVPARGVPERGIRAVTTGHGVPWAQGRTPRRRWMEPGVAGVRLLAWREAIFALTVALGAAGVMAILAAMDDHVRIDQTIVWLVCLLILCTNDLAVTGIRHLRVLPLSTRRLALLLILVPAWRCVLFALGLMAFNATAAGHISLHQQYVMLAVGLGFGALSVCWPLNVPDGTFWGRMATALPAAAMIVGVVRAWDLLTNRQPEHATWLIGLGVFAVTLGLVAMALGLTCFALTHRLTIYRPGPRTGAMFGGAASNGA